MLPRQAEEGLISEAAHEASLRARALDRVLTGLADLMERDDPAAAGYLDPRVFRGWGKLAASAALFASVAAEHNDSGFVLMRCDGCGWTGLVASGDSTLKGALPHMPGYRWDGRSSDWRTR